MSWRWQDCYPGTVTVTLVLDRFEADELLDQARGEGRLIAPATIRGMPMIAFGPEIEPPPNPPAAAPATRKPVQASRLAVVVGAGRPKTKPRPECRKHPAEPSRVTGSPFTRLRRPVVDPPNAVVKQVDPETRAMIDRAVADGRVTRCPPMTFALSVEEEMAQRRPSGAGKSLAQRMKEKRVAAREARRR